MNDCFGSLGAVLSEEPECPKMVEKLSVFFGCLASRGSFIRMLNDNPLAQYVSRDVSKSWIVANAVRKV